VVKEGRMEQTRVKPMKIKKGVGGWTFDIINHLFMAFLMVIFIYPFLNIIAISFSSPIAISAGRVTWLPIDFNLIGYQTVFGGTDRIWKAYGMTIFYGASGTFLTLLLTSMIAYTLTIRDFAFRKFLTIYLAITMFFSGGMIPTYLLIRQLGLYNKIWVMILPGTISAFNVIIFRTFFQSISSEMRESAYIDGANDMRILLQIYLPLSKALLATFGLFAMVGTWNTWYNALIYLKSKDLYPIQMILREVLFVSGATGGVFDAANEAVRNNLVHPENIKMATVIATTGPILIAYPFVQKYFVKGVMIGSIKG
jgi:putative aldouronate transport system permease protein